MQPKYLGALVGTAGVFLAATAAAQTDPMVTLPWQAPSSHPLPLPDYDVRMVEDYQPSLEVQRANGVERGAEMAVARRAAAELLRERVPGVRWDADALLGTPRFVRSTNRFLTEPVAFGRMDPVQITRDFVAEYTDLFELDPEEIDVAHRSRDYMTRHNGVTHLTFQQQIDGVDIFGAEFRANVTRDGALINVGSHMLRRPEGGFSVPVIELRPLEAIHAAAADAGIQMTVDPLPLSSPEGADQRITWSQTQDFRTDQPVTTRLVYFPRTRRDIVPAYYVIVPEIGIGNTYETIVDATSGEILRRWNQLHFLGGTQDVTFRVFPSDSPAPGTPSLPTPDGTQFPNVPTQLLTVTAASVVPYSQEGWIPDGGQETLGNNVDAHLDLNADNVPDLPRPSGGGFRTFDFALDVNQAPTTAANRDGAVTNLFYHCNIYHDRLYALGFDEAAGNFQTNNFGLGGSGGDPVQADAQDGSGVNNANFGTPADGSSGRMQMYVFNGPTPDRDGDLDANIIYHEYSHGLSNRLVGVGQVSGEQAGGMGEGWGDFYGYCLTAEPTDDPNAEYCTGGWTTFELSGLTDNYYFGIRRFPTTVDLTKNPLTYADIDPAQNSYPPGIPQSPIIGNTPDQVHNVGELWSTTLMECRAALWVTHGFAANELIMQLSTDGMKLSPGTPNFLEERDSILQADLVNNAGANLGALWERFAKRGMGSSATSPSGSTTTGIVEAFDTPALILFDYPVGIPDQFQPNQITQFQVNVSGLAGETPTPGTGMLHYRVNGGGFTTLPMSQGAANQYTASVPGGNCFDDFEFYVSVDSSAGTVLDPQQAPAELFAAEVYESVTTFLSDDFETNMGWTVSDAGGLTSGTWERGIPANGNRGDPPADSDGSGQCYLTENVAGNSDVDAGTTTLTSPIIDMTGGALVRYDYWLGDIGSGPLGAEDSMVVEMSSNGGGVWQVMRTYTTALQGWRQDIIDVGTEIAATATMQFRVSVSDLSPGDVVEGGFDAFNVERLECGSGAPGTSYCFGDGTGDPCPCGNSGNPGHGCDNAQGTGGVELTASGDPAANNVVINGSGFPAGTNPTVIVIRSPADENPAVTFGDGLRCIAAAGLVRINAAAASNGASTHAINHGAGAGDFFYQLWYRNNPATFCNAEAFNLSQGYQITWP